MGRRVILQEEIGIDVDAICEALFEQARHGRGSDAVDQLEWKAARIIEQLLFELEEAEKKGG